MIQLKSNRHSANRTSVADSTRRSKNEGLKFTRVFSQKAIAPFDELEWEQRTAEITDDSGKAIFKQENIEVPKSWSALATKSPSRNTSTATFRAATIPTKAVASAA